MATINIISIHLDNERALIMTIIVFNTDTDDHDDDENDDDGDYDVDDSHDNLIIIEIVPIMTIITLHILHSTSPFCSGRTEVDFALNRCHKIIQSFDEIIVPYVQLHVCSSLPGTGGPHTSPPQWFLGQHFWEPGQSPSWRHSSIGRAQGVGG